MIGEELLEILIDNGYKFTKEDIIFIAKNKQERVVWLEKGNHKAGYKHIVERHSKDFHRAFGINEEQLIDFLYKVVTEGNIINEIVTLTLEASTTYDYKGNHYTVLNVGSNGFIVTAYPSKD